MKKNIAKDEESLQRRVTDFFERHSEKINHRADKLSSLSLFSEGKLNSKDRFCAYSSLADFFEHICALFPRSDFYLFGGILRDIAIFGSKGFSSDIDIVVSGDWVDVSEYLESQEASRNKFGGFRLKVKGWDLDIWNAEETWAIHNGLVNYRGISSLLNTTITNWDSILMDWRSKRILCRDGYFDQIANGKLDIILTSNPNPLGMLVRVLRYIQLKDAEQISFSCIEYLRETTNIYGFKDINKSEISSYGKPVIDLKEYLFFKGLSNLSREELIDRFEQACNADNASIKKQLSGQKSMFPNPAETLYAYH